METIASSQWYIMPSVFQYVGAQKGLMRRSAIIHTQYEGTQYKLLRIEKTNLAAIRTYRLKQQGRSVHQDRLAARRATRTPCRVQRNNNMADMKGDVRNTTVE
ncbi:hypothetical protein O0L34_g13752 [Tuta absoluta]|nr:hypothetical protein O0L34_g13752 [Tuta absoluta]